VAPPRRVRQRVTLGRGKDLPTDSRPAWPLQGSSWTAPWWVTCSAMRSRPSHWSGSCSAMRSRPRFRARRNVRSRTRVVMVLAVAMPRECTGNSAPLMTPALCASRRSNPLDVLRVERPVEHRTFVSGRIEHIRRLGEVDAVRNGAVDSPRRHLDRDSVLLPHAREVRRPADSPTPPGTRRHSRSSWRRYLRAFAYTSTLTARITGRRAAGI